MTGQVSAFTSYGRAAGSARVRVYDWLEYLGLPTDVSSYLNTSSNSARVLSQHPLAILRAEAKLRSSIDSHLASTVLISRQASPFSNGRIEERLLAKAERGVYDFDDALMHTPLSAMARVWSKRRIWRRSVETADVVIAGNEYLAEAASRHSRNVTIIPSCVSPESYALKTSYELGAYPRAVWLGSPGTEHYLSIVAEPLLALHESRGLRLTVISAGDGALGALDRMVDRVQWTEQSYQAHLRQADLGIMPLDESPWSRGKCAYKLLQYAATGLPMVGSGVGTNVSVLAAVNGITAGTSDDWHDGVESLIEETAAQRAERGRAGREAITQSYSFAAWAPAWREALGLN
jgi:glycosyltransferase involved in cell wall biosynthesis